MNNRKGNLHRFTGLFILVIMLSACGLGNVSLAKVTPLTPTSMVIFAGMSRSHPGSHGVINIYTDMNGFPNVLTLTPPSGQDETGLTATLWLVIVDHQDTYTSFQVQSGQTISFEGYDIKILRIAEYARGAYFVEVEVTETV